MHQRPRTGQSVRPVVPCLAKHCKEHDSRRTRGQLEDKEMKDEKRIRGHKVVQRGQKATTGQNKRRTEEDIGLASTARGQQQDKGGGHGLASVARGQQQDRNTGEGQEEDTGLGQRGQGTTGQDPDTEFRTRPASVANPFS